MPTPRFYCPAVLPPHDCLPLPQALVHYAVRVLRLKHGDEVVLFNGEGGEVPGVLQVDGRQASVQLGAHRAREAELRGRVTLVQGLPSGDKMDWIIEKAVELGVSRIVPIAAERSVLQLSGERLAKRLAHWQRVVQSAAEQCGRNRLPLVDTPVALRAWLQTPCDGIRLMAHPEAPHTLAQVLATPPTALTLIVGPEGGWSPAEQALTHQGAHDTAVFKWGDRVMRTETAGLALTAAAVSLLDWS